MKKNINLSKIHKAISSRIKLLDFNKLWNGFKPFQFALYTDDAVFFKGKTFAKTNQFVGNTSIEYAGEQIAIWQVTEQDHDLDVLTAKIVHEMFHAYQKSQKESRFPNEMEAIVKYQYSATNLNLKIVENKLLAALLETFDQTTFDLFLAYRAYRKSLNPFNFEYETKVEVIEGTALYVELQALSQLNQEKGAKQLEKVVQKITNCQQLFPIRIISYNIGAIILKILKTNEISFAESIFQGQATYMEQLLTDEVKIKKPKYQDVFSEILNEDEKLLAEIIEKTIKVKPLVEKSYLLYACNIYNARYYQGYLLTKHFIAYLDDNTPVFLYGNYLAKMDENYTISLIYELNE